MAITTVSSHVVSVNAIQGTLIADNAITAVHIATNAVSGTLIADNAITAVHVAQNSITVTQLADDCVESDKIADGVITTNHLNKAMISSQTEVTPVAGDFVLLGDTSDSNNLKKAPLTLLLNSNVDISGKLNLSGGTMTGTIAGFTSTGIDDNADATAITIDSSENVTFAGGLVIPSTITHAGDTDTKLDFNQANTLRLITGDNTAWICSASSMVINEDSIDFDFRVESNNNSSMLFVDGGNDRVGIGDSPRGGQLDVKSQLNMTNSGNVSLVGLKATTFGYASSYKVLQLGDSASSTAANVAIGVDLSGNASGAFSGSGERVYFRNGIRFATPNSSNNNYHEYIALKDGNVGIGDTSPAAKLEIKQGSSNWYEGIRINRSDNATQFGTFSNNGGATFIGAADTTGSDNNAILFVNSTNGTTYTERVRIASDGALVVNNSGGNAQIYLGGTSGTSRMYLARSGSDTLLFNVSDGHMRFGTNNTERMRIESNGDICIGTTGALRGSERISISGGNADTIFTYTHAACIVARKASFTNGFFFLFEANNGTAIGSVTSNGSSTTYNTSSDYRLKENIKPMKNGLDRLNKLNPVSFDWKETGINSEGFLAHEVDEVFSDCVYGEKDGDEIQSMDYGRITPLLVKAIQEQQTIIEDLKSRIATLEE